jgi:hypothetical protein
MNPIEQLARKAADLHVAATPGNEAFTRRVLADIRSRPPRGDESIWGIGASLAVATAVVAVVLSLGSWSLLSNPLSPLTDVSSFALGIQ